jgi:hypothetical protein
MPFAGAGFISPDPEQDRGFFALGREIGPFRHRSVALGPNPSRMEESMDRPAG